MPTAQKSALHNWQATSNEIRKKYRDIGRDELEAAADSIESVVDLISRKTGETRQQVEEFVGGLMSQGSAAAERLGESARQYAGRAGEMAEETYDQMAQRVRDGYEYAQELVQDRPTQSMLVAFGCGALVGTVVTLLLRERR